MATAKRQQQVAAERVAHLPADFVRCRFCGEQTASTRGYKGFAHRWGPNGNHRFMAKKPAKHTATRISPTKDRPPHDGFGPCGEPACPECDPDPLAWVEDSSWAEDR
jgi:hypothetical protein